MLFLEKWTWTPDKREKLQNMAGDLENYKLSHARTNYKVIGKWYATNDNVMFIVYEADKPTVQSNDPWLKHANVETYAVGDARELDVVAKEHGKTTELRYAKQFKQNIPQLERKPAVFTLPEKPEVGTVLRKSGYTLTVTEVPK